MKSYVEAQAIKRREGEPLCMKLRCGFRALPGFPLALCKQRLRCLLEYLEFLRRNLDLLDLTMNVILAIQSSVIFLLD